MPIVFIHGVGVRDEAGFHEISPLLRRYIAPVISDDPATVAITSVFWGPKGVSFAWRGASRPRTRLLAAGAEEVAAGDLEALMATATLPRAFAAQPAAPATGAPSPFTAGQASVGTEPPRRLRELSPEALSDLLALLAAEPIPDPEARADAAIRADAVARDPALVARLAAAPDLEAEIDLALAALEAEEGQEGFLAQGGPGGRWSRLRDRLRETLSRGASLPAYAVSTATAEIRPGLNHFVSYFLGDVFIYLRDRGTSTAPGPIPKLFLDALRQAAANKAARGGEPLVVVSHSMGGQIVYDALTYYLPGDPSLADVQVDFWLASASQVGFFEEAKLFHLADARYRSGAKAPFPPRLGTWWNVWDHNDFLSFTAADIFEGIDDESFDSGLSLLAAHGGYLRRPSFHRRFAEKLQAARAREWARP